MILTLGFIIEPQDRHILTLRGIVSQLCEPSFGDDEQVGGSLYI